jgi:ribosomal-protein-alanine N-acetyltransferase
MPELENTSVVLRRLKLKDTDEYYDLFDKNRDHISRHDKRLHKAFMSISSVAEQLSPYNESTFHHYAIEKDGEFAGSTSLTIKRADHEAEISCWIDKDHIQQGLATAASLILINHAFRWLGTRKVDALIAPSNDPSKRVVERLGFVHSHDLEEYEVHTLDARQFN